MISRSRSGYICQSQCL